jgi:hypothetical protein
MGVADHADTSSSAADGVGRADWRSCRIANVARAHIHALLGIFHRSLMTAMIADSTTLFRYQGKPNDSVFL